MSTDSDVLVARSSPIEFGSGFLPFDGKGRDATLDLEASESCGSAFRSSPALDIRATVGSGCGSSPFAVLKIAEAASTRLAFPCLQGCSDSRPVPLSAFSTAGSPERNRLVPSSDRRRTDESLPRRPCLVVRCDVLRFPSSKSKKKVVFADDRGFPLTLVRTMTEPSNVPPRCSHLFSLPPFENTGVRSEPWEMRFPQPASDYLDFRRRLDVNNVSLENVIVRENEQSVVGTVKVRNLAFRKEVFVRTSTDGWATQEDSFCQYVQNTSSPHGVTILYDTFSFRLTLPPTSRKIEFCVCFRCSGGEYWDNHAGQNYFIVKKDAPIRVEIKANVENKSAEDFSFEKVNFFKKCERFGMEGQSEASRGPWSEYSRWNHSPTNVPYW